MELKPRYKQTEIGVIPEDWDAVDLYNVCTMKSGEGITSKRVDNCSPYPCFGGNGLRGFTTRYTHDGSFALIGRQGALCGNVVPAEGQFFASEHAVVVSARQGVDIRWLTYVLGRMHLNRYSESSAQPGLSVSKVLKLPLAFPPIESEQCAIATALSDADTLLDGLDRLKAKKRDLKKAAMQQLLTGQTRLPGFCDKWKKTRLGNYVTFLRNGVNSRAELLPEGRIKYLHYGDVHASKDIYISTVSLPCLPDAKATSLDRLQEGDLIFADASEDIAGVSKSVEVRDVGSDEFVSGLHTIAARFDKKVLADGFKGFLQFCPPFVNHLRRLAAGTKVYATNRAHIADVEMPLPSIPEQAAIATVLSDMEVEIAALEARSKKTQDLKGAMMQELLTGKTRLVEFGEPHA